MTMAQRIKELRTGRHMTMQELGDKCNVTKATVSMWESGKRRPDSDSQQVLADIFNVSLDYLSGNTDVSMRYLSTEELQIIDTFRHMDKKEKNLVRGMFGIKQEDGQQSIASRMEA